jgi:hypothetical protein
LTASIPQGFIRKALAPAPSPPPVNLPATTPPAAGKDSKGKKP